MPAAYSAREREAREARRRGEFVGFLACDAGRGRIVKVAQPDERQKLRVDCPHCGREHSTAAAMPRPRRRGEQCDVVLPDDPIAEPASARRLTRISNADFLAAIGTDDTPAPLVAKALGLTGSATGASVRIRAEWLNYDAGAERIIITRQGAPNPTMLRLAARD